MKVGLSFPGCHRKGGVERVVFECARFLASRSHEVTVFAQEWEKSQEYSIDYRHIDSRRHPWFLRPSSYFAKCTDALAQTRFDVVNTHGTVCPTGGVHWVQSVHLAWLERSKTFRSSMSLGRWKQRLNPLHPILLRLEAEHFQERKYRKLIATTPEVKSDLQRLYNVPKEDIVVIPNGFSPEEFSPERRNSRRELMRTKLGFRQDHVVLLFVANELERKGYRTLLTALQHLNNPRIRVLVVGRPSRSSVSKGATAFSLAHCVIPCGETNDVAAFHAAADVFVLPTQYEAFSLAILEALGSGLPVVTTKIPGADNAIQIGINGYAISDPTNGEELAAALALLVDDDFRNKLSQNAPQTVSDYRWSSVLPRYERVLVDHSISCAST